MSALLMQEFPLARALPTEQAGMIFRRQLRLCQGPLLLCLQPHPVLYQPEVRVRDKLMIPALEEILGP